MAFSMAMVSRTNQIPYLTNNDSVEGAPGSIVFSVKTMINTNNKDKELSKWQKKSKY